MSDEGSGAVPDRCAASWWPWMIGAGGLLVYLVTLNPWISLSSLATVARASGWTWQPALHEPLTAIVAFSFRWLPQAWIPGALNIFTAACAALVLALLARSVALQFCDHNPPRRYHGHSNAVVPAPGTIWMAPVLATLACGLQLSFWEHATAASGEMVTLLVFAGVVWCLLEFRSDRQQRWLSGGVFIYAAGLANNWTLIIYLPVLLAAIVGLKGLRFFNPRFLLRLSLWGLAGLTFYLLLPCLASIAAPSRIGFWSALKANLQLQAAALLRLPRGTCLILVLTSWVPLLLIAYPQWSSGSPAGEGSPLAAFFTKALLHSIHGGLLGLALWITLDPPSSPRNLGLGSPFLTHYYLSALVLGYCAGYVLLLGAEPRPSPGRARKAARPQRWLGRAAMTGFGVLLVAWSLALAARNLPQIRTTNGLGLRTFARQLCAGVPKGNSVVLSDDLAQLFLARAELAAGHHDKAPLLLDTRSLVWSEYHLVMARQFKSRWPVAPPTNQLEWVEPVELVDLVSRAAPREPVVYLHPSFGYYFERFTDQPHGLVHYLAARGTNGAVGQALDDRLAALNEQFWQDCWTTTLQPLARQIARNSADPPHGRSRLAGLLALAPEQNLTASFLGTAYSKDLNDWGVRLQRLGRWAEAGVWFQRALELKPDNFAAWINLEVNQRRRRGDPGRLDLGSIENRVPGMLVKYRSWEAVLAENGPVDEPTFLSQLARVWLAGGQFRQAAAEFTRCAELAPDWVEPKLGLAQARIRMQDYSDALRLTEQIQAASPPQDGIGQAQLLSCRVAALQGLGRTNDAAACIETFANQYRQHAAFLSTGAQVLMENQQCEPALDLLNRALSREPNNAKLLSDKGLAEMQLSRFAAAIGTLTTVLSFDPTNHVARLNRAISRLRAGQFEAAQEDYQSLLKLMPDSTKVLFGLGEIAAHNRDTPAALQLYQRCLAACDPNSDDYRIVVTRLKRLRDSRAD